METEEEVILGEIIEEKAGDIQTEKILKGVMAEEKGHIQAEKIIGEITGETTRVIAEKKAEAMITEVTTAELILAEITEETIEDIPDSGTKYKDGRSIFFFLFLSQDYD